LIAIIALLVIVHVCGIWWGLPGMPNSWAPDEFSPLTIHDAIGRKFSGGWQVLYPPGHVYVLALVLSPVELLDRAGLVDFGSRQSYLISFLLIRLVSVAMAAITAGVVFRIAREMYDVRSGLFAALAFGLSVPFVFYAKLANVEAPYLLWVALSLLYYLRILHYHRRRDYILFAVTAAIAIGTKDQASALYLLMPLIVPLSDYLRRRESNEHPSLWRAFINSNTAAVVLVGGATLALIHNLAFNADGAVERLRIMTGPITTSLQEFPNTLAGHAGMIALALRHLRFSMGWPFFVAAIAGVLVAILRRSERPYAVAMLAPIVSYWVFLIVPLMYHYDRYLLPVVLILSIFAGRAMAMLTNGHSRLRALRYGAAAAAVVFSIAYAASVDVLLASDGRYAAENWVKAHVAPGSRVMIVGFDLYNPRLDGLDVITSVEPTLDELASISPDYVITTSIFDEWRFRGTPPVLTFFQAVAAGKTEYRLVFVQRGRPRFTLLNLDGVRTNLDKVNPEIRIYQRARSSASRTDP
jgi:hypothetical protein